VEGPRVSGRQQGQPLVSQAEFRDVVAASALRGLSLTASVEKVTVGLLKRVRSVTLCTAKNLRDADSTRVRRPFTSFRVTRIGFFNGPTVPDNLSGYSEDTLPF
jgi:hypothetical protein